MLKSPRLRQVLTVLILAVTAGLFVAYFRDNPDVGRQLRQTSPLVLVAVFGLYLAFMASLAMINTATLRLCQAQIGRRESLLLAVYSSIINFFGPLQSGPAFRAVYVNRKHGIKLRDYTMASFVYYFFYAVFSGALLLAGWFKGWAVLGTALLLVGVYLVLKSQSVVLRPLRRLVLSKWHYMALASLVQISIVMLIYYVELNSITPGLHFSQVAAYTGAANFALFVSLTPGAIGFRESFLLFSQNLHHIDSPTIVAASLIDRSVYIVLLAMLAIYIFSTHARQRLLSGT